MDSSLNNKDVQIHRPDEFKLEIDQLAAKVVDHLFTFCNGDLKINRNEVTENRVGDAATSFIEVVRSRFSQLENHITELHEQRAKLVAELKQKQEEAEQASAANHAKDIFLANMSHEIRTPLTAILGFANLMLEPHLNAADLGEFSQTITRNAEHLLSLIDEVLDFAKIEAGKIIVEKRQFSLPEMFRGIENLFRTNLRNKSLSLSVKISQEFEQPIIADLVRLQQVVINLVGNAVKFTDSGLVEVNVDLLKSGPQKMLQISVSDTGIGISREAQAKLFSPFMQADSSVTKKYGGSGLGLALSRRLAEALGGELRLLNSELGKGSTFVLTVPIEMATSDSSVQGVPALAETISRDDTRLAGLRILLAEDSADNQLLYRRFLERSAATVEIAGDGSEAISMATNQSFDLVLMDIQMPLVNGYEATQQLRRSGFTKPILALTAHALEREIQNMEAAGCSGRIVKPVQPDELIDCIIAAAQSVQMSRPQA